MALVKFDGFLWQNSLSDLQREWTVSLNSGSISYQQAGRRASSKSIYFNSLGPTYPMAILTGYNMQSGVVGVALYRPTATDVFNIQIVATNGNEHVSLRVPATTDGQVYVSRNGTTLWTSTDPNFKVPPATWTYLEFKFNVHASSGNFTVRVNGSDDAKYFSGSVNTEGQTGVAVGFVHLQVVNNAMYITDFYLCDLTGPAPANDMLGDCRVDRLAPTSDGSHTDFTPSTGVSHFAMVDELIASATDYNLGATLNAHDSYGFEDLAFTPTNIFGLQVRRAAWKTDCGARSLSAAVKTEGTEYIQSPAVLSTSMLMYETDVFLNPSTGEPWTLAQVQALEAGVKVTL